MKIETEQRLVPLITIKIGSRHRAPDEGSPEFEELVSSIEEHGLLHPIALTPDLELIAGFRRYSACKKLGYETIPANIVPIDKGKLSVHILEVIENKARKSMTWQEELRGKGTVFELAKERGMTTDKEISKWLGQSRALTSLEMTTLRYAQKNSHIWDCDTKTQAFSVAARMREKELATEFHARTVNLRRQTEDIISVSSKQQALINHVPLFNDAIGMLHRIEPNSVDVCVTDPPYGLDMESMEYKKNQSKIYGEYKDTRDAYNRLMDSFIGGLKVVMKPGAHVYICVPAEEMTNKKNDTMIKCEVCGSFIGTPDSEFNVREKLKEAGFFVYPLPIIWVKGAGQSVCCQPAMYPSSAYEAIIFAFAPGEKRSLIKQGQPNVITDSPRIASQRKNHPFEKPVSFYENLLSRSANPGDLVIDPFSGSAPAVEAASNLGCRIMIAEQCFEYRVAIMMRYAKSLKARIIDEDTMTKLEILEKKYPLIWP